MAGITEKSTSSQSAQQLGLVQETPPPGSGLHPFFAIVQSGLHPFFAIAQLGAAFRRLSLFFYLFLDNVQFS